MSQNVTLSLPEPLLRRFRVLAAERNTSMSGLMVQAIEHILDSEDGARVAQARFVDRAERSPNRLDGGVTWTRDDLHRRG